MAPRRRSHLDRAASRNQPGRQSVLWLCQFTDSHIEQQYQEHYAHTHVGSDQNSYICGVLICLFLAAKVHLAKAPLASVLTCLLKASLMLASLIAVRLRRDPYLACRSYALAVLRLLMMIETSSKELACPPQFVSSLVRSLGARLVLTNSLLCLPMMAIALPLPVRQETVLQLVLVALAIAQNGNLCQLAELCRQAVQPMTSCLAWLPFSAQWLSYPQAFLDSHSYEACIVAQSIWQVCFGYLLPCVAMFHLENRHRRRFGRPLFANALEDFRPTSQTTPEEDHGFPGSRIFILIYVILGTQLLWVVLDLGSSIFDG